MCATPALPDGSVTRGDEKEQVMGLRVGASRRTRVGTGHGAQGSRARRAGRSCRHLLTPTLDTRSEDL